MENTKTIESIISIIILVVVTVLMFVEIVVRYLFSSSLIWSEEISRYLFIWFVYVSMSYAISERAHIKIDSVMYIIPKHLRVYFTQIGLIIWIVFAGILSFYTLDYAISMFEKGTYSSASRIPMGIIYIGIPIGFLLSIYRLIKEFIFNIKNMKSVRK